MFHRYRVTIVSLFVGHLPKGIDKAFDNHWWLYRRVFWKQQTAWTLHTASLVRSSWQPKQLNRTKWFIYIVVSFVRSFNSRSKPKIVRSIITFYENPCNCFSSKTISELLHSVLNIPEKWTRGFPWIQEPGLQKLGIWEDRWGKDRIVLLLLHLPEVLRW